MALLFKNKTKNNHRRIMVLSIFSQTHIVLANRLQITLFPVA